ncbi:Maf family protein [Calothrix sp. CCY 0018]|uniref:Maf family protein n=1 Tax=Calothrix sp. CCY 0018 TaxID=3103864 RepID=UPI0039C5FA2B
MGTPTFVLASASTARRRLLQNAGIQPFVYASNFDESQIQVDNPAELVETLALRKAETVAPHFQTALIMGCDSVLAINGEIHGKPANPEEARQRWLMMRGNCGELFTGHVFIDNTQSRSLIKHQVTKVYFASVSEKEINAYVATEEPLKCAGAFALEGKGAVFVEKIEGCHSNVIGLSMPLLRIMLLEMGYSITDFWR